MEMPYSFPANGGTSRFGARGYPTPQGNTSENFDPKAVAEAVVSAVPRVTTIDDETRRIAGQAAKEVFAKTGDRDVAQEVHRGIIGQAKQGFAVNPAKVLADLGLIEADYATANDPNRASALTAEEYSNARSSLYNPVEIPGHVLVEGQGGIVKAPIYEGMDEALAKFLGNRKATEDGGFEADINADREFKVLGGRYLDAPTSFNKAETWRPMATEAELALQEKYDPYTGEVAPQTWAQQLEDRATGRDRGKWGQFSDAMSNLYHAIGGGNNGSRVDAEDAEILLNEIKAKYGNQNSAQFLKDIGTWRTLIASVQPGEIATAVASIPLGGGAQAAAKLGSRFGQVARGVDLGVNSADFVASMGTAMPNAEDLNPINAAIAGVGGMGLARQFANGSVPSGARTQAEQEHQDFLRNQYREAGMASDYKFNNAAPAGVVDDAPMARDFTARNEQARDIVGRLGRTSDYTRLFNEADAAAKERHANRWADRGSVPEDSRLVEDYTAYIPERVKGPSEPAPSEGVTLSDFEVGLRNIIEITDNPAIHTLARTTHGALKKTKDKKKRKKLEDSFWRRAEELLAKEEEVASKKAKGV